MEEEHRRLRNEVKTAKAVIEDEKGKTEAMQREVKSLREEAERAVAERTPVGLCLPRFVTLTTDVPPNYWYSVEEKKP